jgi:hypothetical protein
MSSAGAIGQMSPDDTATDFTAISFLIRQTLAYVRTAQIVQVKAVTTTDTVAGSGYVSIQPLVNLTDGLGNFAGQHGTLQNIPFLRLQAGTNAIINDPQVGDIGLAVFCDRDISAVKNALAPSNPGSFRRFDMSDGIYLFTILAATPTQYLQFIPAGGMTLADSLGNLIQMLMDGIEITTLTLTVDGNLVVTTAPSGTFTSADGKTITVTSGIITAIV